MENIVISLHTKICVPPRVTLQSSREREVGVEIRSCVNIVVVLLYRLKLIGTYGLRCKREVWRTQLVLAKLR